jgi:SAM-dependent methyltransferase
MLNALRDCAGYSFRRLPSWLRAKLGRMRRLEIGWRAFLLDLHRFNRGRAALGEPPVSPREMMPCLFDRTEGVGFDPHYTFHTAWAGRVLAESRPARHVDVGSHLMFIVACSAFVPIEHYDIRAVDLGLDNLQTGAADLTALPWDNDSIPSLSCMHVLEHVGLGRYGDPVDPQGDRKAMSELARVVAPGGQLLFVVPVGRPRIQFNAHRIYDVDSILRGLKGLELAEFALIPTNGRRLIRNADLRQVSNEANACGCFRFVKPAN